MSPAGNKVGCLRWSDRSPREQRPKRSVERITLADCAKTPFPGTICLDNPLFVPQLQDGFTFHTWLSSMNSDRFWWNRCEARIPDRSCRSPCITQSARRGSAARGSLGYMRTYDIWDRFGKHAHKSNTCLTPSVSVRLDVCAIESSTDSAYRGQTTHRRGPPDKFLSAKPAAKPPRCYHVTDCHRISN